MSDLLLPRSVRVKGSKTDGRPPGYWQQYPTDEGPYEFPLASPLITKRLPFPDLELVALKSTIVDAYSWLLAFSLLALMNGSLFWLLVAAAGFLVRCRAIVAQLLSMYPDLVPYWSSFRSRFSSGGGAPASGGARRFSRLGGNKKGSVWFPILSFSWLVSCVKSAARRVKSLVPVGS